MNDVVTKIIGLLHNSNYNLSDVDKAEIDVLTSGFSDEEKDEIDMIVSTAIMLTRANQ